MAQKFSWERTTIVRTKDEETTTVKDYSLIQVRVDKKLAEAFKQKLKKDNAQIKDFVLFAINSYVGKEKTDQPKNRLVR